MTFQQSSKLSQNSFATDMKTIVLLFGLFAKCIQSGVGDYILKPFSTEITRLLKTCEVHTASTASADAQVS